MRYSTTEGALNHVVVHPLDPVDGEIVAAARVATGPMKGTWRGIEARGIFDGIMEGVQPRDDVRYEAGVVGGIPGVWVHPVDARPDEVILHVHGGWFSLGSAQAYRHFVGHLAARAQASAFVADYRLAPEHPFPAALEDVLACYEGLAAAGSWSRIVVTGDSAGGNLALVTVSRVAGGSAAPGATLVGVVAISPVTDLTLSGNSYERRAEADPYFTRSQAVGYVQAYLGNADPKNPLASPIFAQLTGMPPMLIHVGDDEVLLDDSSRYVERAVEAGVDARLELWLGMPHVFLGSVGHLKAASQALDAVGSFLRERLQADAGQGAPR